MTLRATIAVAGMCMSAGALAAPPAKYYQEDTAAMVRVNLASITVDNVKAAVNALVTQADLDAADIPVNLEADVMPQVNQVGMMQMMTMGLTSNGGNVVNIVVAPPAGGMGGEPRVNLLLAAESAEAAEKLRGAVQGFGAMMPGGGLEAGTELSGGEFWVVASPAGGAPTSGEGSAARRDALTGALESVGENTLSVGLVPSEKMIADMLDNVNDEHGEAMISTMMKADWMGMWLSVDGTPELGVRMKYADAELAEQMEQLYAGAMGFMQAQAREADAQMEDAPAEFKPSAVAEKLSGWLAMEREGGVCTIKLDPREMRQLTLLAIKAGPMLRQNPMFGEFIREFQRNMPMN